jgi:hypothetical protein
LKASPSNRKTTRASSRSKLDPLGFITRNKVPTVQSWRTTALTPASKIQLRPGEGFGIDCGRNGIVVVDSDTRLAHTELLTMWEENEGTGEIDTYTVRTPRGWHTYLNAIEGVTLGNSASKLASNLDTRGVGGYVNGPPTPGYRVTKNVPLLDTPGWLAQRLSEGPKRARTAGTFGDMQHSIGGLTFKLANAQEGTRNDVLHWCLHRAAEMPAGRQRSALRALRQEARMIGLGDSEIEKTIASVWKQL